MPIVPRVNPAPLPGVRVGGSAPEAAFGGGAGDATLGLNPGLSAVHGEAARIAQDEGEKADQVALTDAKSRLMSTTTDLLYGRNGLLTRQGKDAFTAPEDAREHYGAAIEKIREGLGNDRQRQAFSVVSGNQWNQINEQVQSHVASQRQKYDVQTTSAAVENAQNLALQSYDKPDIVESLINGVRDDTKAFGARNGWSDDQVKELIDRRTSDTRVGVLSRMLDNENDLGASKYYEQYRDQIDGVAQGKIERALGIGSTQGIAQRTSDQIVAGKYAPGLVTPGNIDLTSRPRVKNADGSVSTVRSISIEEDGKTVLIPTVVNGKVVSDDDAVAHYRQSGEQLGTFTDEAHANAYAQQLHASQARLIAGGPQITATEALAQAESIQDPRVRKKALDLVTSHFNELDHAQRIDRENARSRVLQDLRANNGRLNQASSDWQLIAGYPEGEHVLDEQHQILHPPPERGDPDKYNSYVAMAATSPATRQMLLTTSISEIVDDKTLSGGQKTAIINMIRSERTKDVVDLRRDASEADRDAKALEKIVTKARAEKDQETIDANVQALYAAQQKATLLRGQLITAARTAHFGAPSGSGTAADETPQTTAPATGAAAHANPLGLRPLKPITPEMLRDLATYGEGYADHLRKSGYAVPAVLPKPELP